MRQDQGVSLAPDSGGISPTPSAQVPPKVDSRYLPTSSLRRLVDQHLQELVIAVVALALVLFFTVDSPYFFTIANAAALASFIAPIAFFAVAEVPILIQIGRAHV